MAPKISNEFGLTVLQYCIFTLREKLFKKLPDKLKKKSCFTSVSSISKRYSMNSLLLVVSHLPVWSPQYLLI